MAGVRVQVLGLGIGLRLRLRLGLRLGLGWTAVRIAYIRYAALPDRRENSTRHSNFGVTSVWYTSLMALLGRLGFNTTP